MMCKDSPASAAPAAVPDPAAAARKWRHVKLLPLAERLHYLESQDAIDSMPPRPRLDRLRGVQAEINRLMATLPTDSWIVAAVHQGLQLPPPDPDRRHGESMKLSEAFTAIGDGRPTRRWTPPQAVEVGDLLDMLSARQAMFYESPQSPSALSILRYRFGRGRADGDGYRQGKSKALAKMKHADAARVGGRGEA